jgi:phage regulator Rha-like protein
MSENNQIIPINNIQNFIFSIRGLQVMIDRDLAELYQVENKRLNEQIKRNITRFPMKFRFQLNDDERNELVANCDQFKNLKHSSVNPYAFTEQGVSMLSAVLRSETAIKISIQIIDAFVEMRKFNKQYSQVEVKEFSVSHDQFLILDDFELYHFGASLKDLGKKWFAFLKMDMEAVGMLENLKKVKLV